MRCNCSYSFWYLICLNRTSYSLYCPVIRLPTLVARHLHALIREAVTKFYTIFWRTEAYYWPVSQSFGCDLIFYLVSSNPALYLGSYINSNKSTSRFDAMVANLDFRDSAGPHAMNSRKYILQGSISVHQQCFIFSNCLQSLIKIGWNMCYKLNSAVFSQ